MADEVLTVEEAAAFLKVCHMTVRKLLKNGELPGRRVGKQWRLTKRALLHYIDGEEGGNRPETSKE